MMVNPGKFQAIIIDKKKKCHTNETLKIGDKIIKASSSVKLLGVQIDDQLNFNLHISNICRSAANQLNALIRLKRFLAFEEKKTLINIYFYSNFNYCPLAWMFSSSKSLNKVESLQKRALPFFCDNYDSSYEFILKLAGKTTVNVAKLTSLCVDIFKTLNNINLAFMNEIFDFRKTNRTVRNQCKLNLEVLIINQVTFGAESIRYPGSKIWNSLPFHIKSSESRTTFKRIIKKLGYGLMRMPYLSALEYCYYIMIHTSYVRSLEFTSFPG